MRKWSAKRWERELMGVGVFSDGVAVDDPEEAQITRYMGKPGEPLTLADILAGVTAGEQGARRQVQGFSSFLYGLTYPPRRLRDALELLPIAVEEGNQEVVAKLLASFSPDDHAMIDAALATRLREPSYDDDDDDDE